MTTLPRFFSLACFASALFLAAVRPSVASADDTESPAVPERAQQGDAAAHTDEDPGAPPEPAPKFDQDQFAQGNRELWAGVAVMTAATGAGVLISVIGWAASIECSSSNFIGLPSCSSTEQWWLAFPAGIGLGLAVGLPLTLAGRQHRRDAQPIGEPEVVLNVAPTGGSLAVRF